MKILEVVESKLWKNIKTGATISVYGACPWGSDADRPNWTLETVGYTWRLDNGTVGLGRVPAKTRDEALEVMAKFNALGRNR